MKHKDNIWTHRNGGMMLCVTMIVGIMLIACNAAPRKDISFLKDYDGRYPFDVKLFEDERINARIQPLLGERYNFVKDSMVVCAPISVADSVVSISGCQRHNCSSTNYLIVVDLPSNKVYAGIRENDSIQTYSETGSKHPYIELWEQPLQ